MGKRLMVFGLMLAIASVFLEVTGLYAPLMEQAAWDPSYETQFFWVTAILLAVILQDTVEGFRQMRLTNSAYQGDITPNHDLGEFDISLRQVSEKISDKENGCFMVVNDKQREVCNGKENAQS